MNAPKVTPTLPDAQTVIGVQHYTDRLFSFKVTRPKTLRFRSGEFVMIGLLKEDGKPLLRAYSIASPAWDDELEFYSIKVQDGPLTSKLQHVKKGDQIIVGEAGVKISPPERPREGVNVFEFMGSASSSERPSQHIAKQVADDIYNRRLQEINETNEAAFNRAYIYEYQVSDLE